jgi:hypothetical protein
LTDVTDDSVPLDPGFGERFTRQFRPACQLYVVSPPAIEMPAFAERLKAALSGGPVAAFQLRLKDVADDVVLRAAEALLPICAEHDVAFLLNDRADLAKQCGADGVHLGQSDGSIAEARALLGPDAQIGRTCHDSRHIRSILRNDDQAQPLSPDPRYTDVVDDNQPIAVRRDRRHHAGQCCTIGGGGGGFYRSGQRGLAASARARGRGGGIRGRTRRECRCMTKVNG